MEMPVEQARSPPPGGRRCEENPAEEPPKTVFLLPVYAVAVVDPNELGEGGLPLTFGGEATEPELAVDQKRQKLVVMRKRGAILEYDDDDPHKPTPQRLRNRMKSQKSRDRKKAYMSALESKVKELEKRISELEDKCLILQSENELLKNEALETDPGVMEEMMLYYDKLEEDKEITGKPVQSEEDAPGKTAGCQAGTLEKCSGIMDQESSPEIDIGEGTLETEINDEEVTSQKCGVVDDQEVLAGNFTEIDDLEYTSEIRNGNTLDMKDGLEELDSVLRN